ncbi:50S ribosomal protein L25/general stress protein Ctc [Desulfobacterales bacterium HSG2]|nr:50S ribosomal protein L25/general stress protein Ctc [Desulfobacterales bacterium HSG2]
MERLELKTDVRTGTGKGPARVLRSQGKIPAILYGPDTEPVMLSVNIRELENCLKKTSSAQILLDLVIQNGETTTRPAMIRELQTHPLSQNFLHVDFYEVAMDRKIRARVPVRTTGKSKGVELGGMLQIIRRELEVLCFPNEIPEVIEVDATDLDIGESIHVNEIHLEGNVEISAEVNFTVITVLSPKGAATEEEEEGEEEAAEEEAAKAAE